MTMEGTEAVGTSDVGTTLGGGTPAPVTETGGQNVSTAAPGGPEPKEGKPQPTGLASLGKKANANVKGTESATPAGYQPNFKFKVLDKEHEFDDWLKASVKDAETEKKARELYEKAFGLDSVKQDRQTLKSELGQAKEKIAQTDQTLERIGNFARANDWDSFFESLQIPKERILQYAIQVAQREQDPKVKAAWEENRVQTVAKDQLSEQSQQFSARQQEFAVKERRFEMREHISGNPEVLNVARAYDAGIGSPGAFGEFVIRIGAAYAAQGQDIPVPQAVAEAIKHLRAANPTLGISAPVAPPMATSQVVSPNAKPVIPNMGGRGNSPVKSTIKSLDDLKQRSRELNGGSF